MSVPAVWVTRPEPGNRRTAQALAAAGYAVIAAPVLEVSTVVPEGFRPREWPQWLVLVSASAVRGLAALDAAGRLPGSDRSRVRVAAVGKHTAEAAREVGWRVDLLPAVQDASGLRDALANEAVDGAEVWIPAGNREGSATRDLPRHLRARGAQVTVFRVYETAARPLSGEERERLAGAAAGAVVLHSPSAAEAVYAVPPEGEGGGERLGEGLRPWRTVPAVCIGPATAARCRESARIQILECKSPSDRDIVDALSSMPSLLRNGKDVE